jgi:hypothetical protein
MSILVTYAVSLVIEGVLNMVFSVNYVELHAWYVDRSVKVFGFWLPYIYLLGIRDWRSSCSAALYVMLYRTRFGMSVRASLADQTSAALVGINVKNVSTICFGIGVAVTAAGGMIYGATNAFNASSSYDLISRLLVIIVLGGMGSLGGALVAGIMMVTVEDLVSVIWGPVWSNLTFFLILVIVLSLRPQGIFGKQSRRGSRDVLVSSNAWWLLAVALVFIAYPLIVTNPDLDDDWNIRSDLHGVRDVVEHVLRLLGLRQSRLRRLLRRRCVHDGLLGQIISHGPATVICSGSCPSGGVVA